MDRLRLNSQIERLIESKGHDEASRNAVAEFALTIRTPSPVEIETLYRGSGGAMSGQTPEHGQVQIGEDKPDAHEFSRGVVRERVGYYKLARYQLRRKHWVVISHFWKADETTQSETELAQEWVLALDGDNRPLWFGERGFKHLWALKLTKYLQLQISRELYPETWGPTPGAVHKGALHFDVTIDQT